MTSASTTPFVGRSDLMRELEVACADAAAGNGALFLLLGDAGIGKTTVARRVAVVAAERGLGVSWGRCTADRAAPPLWPWARLVEAVLEQADSFTDRAAVDAIGGPRFELLRTLRDHVFAAASDAGSLHVIEDLQWADVASVLLLDDIAADIERSGLLVVGTLRTGEPLGGALDEALDYVRREARVREIHALDGSDVETMIKAAGISPDPELTALVLARTGGNPLFVAELLRGVSSQRRAGSPLEVLAGDVPGRVSELVDRRRARLPQAVADLLASAAVLGYEGDVRVLADVHGLGAEPTLELLEQARASHLLSALSAGRWQFRHEIVRDAVYESLSEADRPERHGRALEALTKDAATPPAVLAAHALAALPLLDPERAVALAARAGETAFDQLAYEEAVTWFEKALRVAPASTSRRWRGELLLLSGDAHRQMGETKQSQRVFRAAADLVDEPALVARAALGYADPGADLGIAFRSEDPTTARLLERAIALQPEGDSLTAVRLESRLAAELYFSEVPERSRELATRAQDAARRLDDPRGLSAAMAVYHDAFVVGQADLDDRLRGSEQLLEWARASEAPVALLAAHRARVFDLLSAGDFARMDAEIVAFRRVADPLQIPAYQWWPALWTAMRALLEGRHDEAESLAFRAYQLGEKPFAPLAFLNLSFLLFFLRREQGRLAELEETTREVAAAQADVPAIRIGLIFLLAELGQFDEAAGRLTDVDERTLERLHDRNWPATWFQLARVSMLTNDRDRAAHLLEPSNRPSDRCVTVSLATACLGAVDLAVAWLHHTVGDLDAGDRSYRHAEALNARIGARSWLTQARIDHARLLLDRDGADDRVAARGLLDLVTPAADAIGLACVTADVDEVRARLAGEEGAEVGAGDTTTGSFLRAGDVWELDYAGRVARVPHARGLTDIAFLLSRPGTPVPAIELVGVPGAPDPSRVRGAPTLDERARREIRDRLRDLDAEIDDAETVHDRERAARAREQRQALAEAVAKDLGLGGRARRLDDPLERARKTVSTRIRRAIAQIEGAHPELGRHLDRSVDTGTWCAYRPAETVTWHV